MPRQEGEGGGGGGPPPWEKPAADLEEEGECHV